MKKLPKDLQDYILFCAPSEITTLMQPLERHFGITYFLFVRELNNGKRMWLTNNGAWSEHFYAKEYYQISAFENPAQKKTAGIYPWQFLKGQEVFQEAREYFNIDHGATLVEIYPDKTEFFHFASFPKNYQVNQLYTEHKDVLYLFVKFFKDKAKNLITQLENKTIDIPMPSSSLCIPAEADFTQEQVAKFVQTIANDRYYLYQEPHSVYLTQKELECMKWSVKGKTSEEIALLMNISKRTVEAHMENVKQKMNCYKQFQLGYKLGKYPFL